MTPEEFNKWRVMPRILVALYCYLIFMVTDWFIDLDDPTTQQSAFVSTIIGVAGLIFNFYVQTGEKKE